MTWLLRLLRMSLKITKFVVVVVLNCRFKRTKTVMKTSKRSYSYKTAAFYVERTSAPVFYFIFSFQIMFDVIWKFENNNNNKTIFIKSKNNNYFILKKNLFKLENTTDLNFLKIYF